MSPVWMTCSHTSASIAQLRVDEVGDDVAHAGVDFRLEITDHAIPANVTMAPMA